MISEAVSGLLGVLIGGLLGHRLAIGRDKRREFNEVVGPVHLSLLKALDDIDNGHSWTAWEEDDMYKVKAHISGRNLKKLNILMEAYWKKHKESHQQDGMGGFEIIQDKLPGVKAVLIDIRRLLALK